METNRLEAFTDGAMAIPLTIMVAPGSFVIRLYATP